MTQEHCFLASELALKAQAGAAGWAISNKTYLGVGVIFHAKRGKCSPCLSNRLTFAA